MDVDENLTDLPELENEDSERYVICNNKHFNYIWW